VIRGGGWPYPAGFLRTANRGGSAATLRANDRGFRLAR
jgi:formylglycine-generating enzyme required for sulfatase activity